jgi:hypothetical protein
MSFEQPSNRFQPCPPRIRSSTSSRGRTAETADFAQHFYLLVAISSSSRRNAAKIEKVESEIAIFLSVQLHFTPHAPAANAHGKRGSIARVTANFKRTQVRRWRALRLARTKKLGAIASRISAPNFDLDRYESGIIGRFFGKNRPSLHPQVANTRVNVEFFRKR